MNLLKNHFKELEKELGYIENLERKYYLFNFFPHSKFIQIYENVDKLKVNLLLLHKNFDFFNELKNISCNNPKEHHDWFIEHHKNMYELYLMKYDFFKITELANYFGIISFCQFSIMNSLHDFIFNILTLDKVYSKEMIDNNGNIISYKIPSDNEISFYFDIIEIILKVLKKIYNDSMKNKHNMNLSLIDDNNYLRCIDIVKNKISVQFS